MVEERAQGRAFICFCTSPYLYRVILHFACSYIYTTLTLFVCCAVDTCGHLHMYVEEMREVLPLICSEGRRAPSSMSEV
jgi:hypothetical protein